MQKLQKKKIKYLNKYLKKKFKFYVIRANNGQMNFQQRNLLVGMGKASFLLS